MIVQSDDTIEFSSHLSETIDTYGFVLITKHELPNVVSPQAIGSHQMWSCCDVKVIGIYYSIPIRR